MLHFYFKRIVFSWFSLFRDKKWSNIGSAVAKNIYWSRWRYGEYLHMYNDLWYSFINIFIKVNIFLVCLWIRKEQIEKYSDLCFLHINHWMGQTFLPLVSSITPLCYSQQMLFELCYKIAYNCKNSKLFLT